MNSANSKKPVSIALETSCLTGGVALDCGDEIIAMHTFNASARHATVLLSHVDKLLKASSLRPRDIDEVYISVGPGSFTGLRVGVTVAKVLAQAVADMRCVAVPTTTVVAENAASLDWQKLAVVLDARENQIYTRCFSREDGKIIPSDEPVIVTAEQFLAETAKPILLTGEGIRHHEQFSNLPPEVEVADEVLHLPKVENVWKVGKKMALAGEFTDYRELLPIYTRKPAALRQWEDKNNRSVK